MIISVFYTGHCAKKATTVLMEHGSNRIVHLEIGDAKETQNISGRLERLLLERCLRNVRQHGVNITELITHASRTAINLLGNVSAESTS